MGPGFNTLILKIFEKCAGNSGCEVCRPHMEDDCLFFPELYRLHDLAQDSKNRIKKNPGEFRDSLGLSPGWV